MLEILEREDSNRVWYTIVWETFLPLVMEDDVMKFSQEELFREGITI